MVESLDQYDEHITARVRGTETYRVDLWIDEDGTLAARCTCPLGVDHLFCKHCVAVALAWIEEPPPYHPASTAPKKSGTTMQDVQHYLAQQNKETLVRIILDRAQEDDRWREHLLMKTAAQQEGGADINTFRRALRKAIQVDGFVEYDDAYEYADAVQSVVNGLEDLLNQGYARDVINLCAEAIALIEEALDSVDDSDGHFDSIVDRLHVWQDFSRGLSLQLYQKLKEQAEKINSWPKWREEALAYAREVVDQKIQINYRFSPPRTGYSLLVEIFLWEGDDDRAWLEAQTGGCHPTLWMQLAEARAEKHPEDAVSIYQPRIEPLIDQTKNEGYKQAIELLLKVKELMVRLNQESEFKAFVAKLSTTHKRKRNFIALLEKNGLAC